MLKVFKYLIVVLTFSALTFTVVNAATQDSAYEIVLSDNFGYIEQMVLESSRYTQPDNVTPAALQEYRDDYTLSFTTDELAFLGYEEILNDSKLRVYFEQKSFSVVIENKETGYFWSSRAEFQHIEGTSETPLFRNMMNSGLWIESVRMLTNGGAPININEKSLTTESLYRIAGVAYPNDESLIATYPECGLGYATSNVCTQVIIPERYNQSRVRVYQRDYGQIDKEAPSKVTDISLQQLANTIYWKRPDDDFGVEKFNIYIDGEFKGVARLNQFTFGGLTKGQTYSIRIEAVDFRGRVSKLSEPFSFTFQEQRGE